MAASAAAVSPAASAAPSADDASRVSLVASVHKGSDGMFSARL